MLFDRESRVAYLPARQGAARRRSWSGNLSGVIADTAAHFCASCSSQRTRHRRGLLSSTNWYRLPVRGTDGTYVSRCPWRCTIKTCAWGLRTRSLNSAGGGALVEEVKGGFRIEVLQLVGCHLRLQAEPLLPALAPYLEDDGLVDRVKRERGGSQSFTDR
eukprot:scaffold3761_cov372-Prasinococcus_capsulatus_cf.AAC.17